VPTKKISLYGIQLPVEKPNMQGAVLSVVLAMVITVPLVSGTALRDIGKTLLFEFLGCILIALLVSQINFSHRAISEFKSRICYAPAIFVILMILYASASYIYAPYKVFARAELFRILICGLVYLTVGLYVRGKERLKLIIDVLLAVAALVSIISLASIGDGFAAQGVTGTFGTHETLGSFLMLVLPIALPIALSDIGEQKRQIFAQAVTLLIAAALLMAHTRSAWLGSAFSLGVLAILYWRFPLPLSQSQVQSPAQRRAIKMAPVIIIAAAIVLFILASHQSGSILKRVSTLGNLSQDVSAKIRRQMIAGAVDMVKARPLFGWGLGSYAMLASTYTHYGDTAGQLAKTGPTLRNNAHDFYLQYAAEQGFVGLFIYCGMIITFLVHSFRSIASIESGYRKLILIGCISASAGQCVDAILSPSYVLPSVSLFQFLILGIGTLATVKFNGESIQSGKVTVGTQISH
jgi:O-antigen ligase